MNWIVQKIIDLNYVATSNLCLDSLALIRPPYGVCVGGGVILCVCVCVYMCYTVCMCVCVLYCLCVSICVCVCVCSILCV